MHARGRSAAGRARRAALWHVTRTQQAAQRRATAQAVLLRAESSLGMDMTRDYRPFDASLTLSSTCASYFTAKCEK